MGCSSLLVVDGDAVARSTSELRKNELVKLGDVLHLRLQRPSIVLAKAELGRLTMKANVFVRGQTRSRRLFTRGG